MELIMDNIPLLQKALSEDWHKLPAVIQRHYSIDSGSGSRLKGCMEVGYPNHLLPLISMIHLCGGLVLRRGKAIETQVEKTTSNKNTALFWKRTLAYADNNKDYFYSQMLFLQKYELIEMVRYGFGLRLKVSVESGNLVYRSNGHIWQYRKLRLTFPDWLLLGRATIIETPVSDKQFSFDFSIEHPFWGKCYWYQGVFQYCD